MSRPKVDPVERVFALYRELTAEQRAELTTLLRGYEWATTPLPAAKPRTRTSKPKNPPQPTLLPTG